MRLKQEKNLCLVEYYVQSRKWLFINGQKMVSDVIGLISIRCKSPKAAFSFYSAQPSKEKQVSAGGQEFGSVHKPL
jgi:hypothetical protein